MAVLVGAVLLRAFPFVWWPSAHFDSDQATVGLMARHISEGRAFPLYYYGQTYMLAVEAYAAAPVMWALGATVTALKLPLVLVNLAVVILLLRLLVHDAGLSPWTAGIAVLPLALPAAPIAARTTEAMGGNVEPWLYVLLLWMLRERPFGFGTLLGIGVLHREFTAYGAVALLAMDGVSLMSARPRRPYAAARARHWALVAIAALAVRAVAGMLQPFANAWGPGTHGDDPWVPMPEVELVGGRVCFAPEAWADRTRLLFGDHLPRLVGGIGAPLQDYGVHTGVYSGQPGLGPWVGVLTLIGLLGGVAHWWTRRRSPAPEPMPHLGGYLVLVGVVSTAIYGYLSCAGIRVETLRYNLLAIFIPVGALIMAMQAWRAPLVRAGVAAAVALWCAINTLDVVVLIESLRDHPLVDYRQVLADDLVARGVTSARAPFRAAYHVTFLADERVRVAASEFPRIRAYNEEAARTFAPSIVDLPCEGGVMLANGQHLCPHPHTAVDSR